MSCDVQAIKDYAEAAASGSHDPGELNELLQERLAVFKHRMADRSTTAADLVSSLAPRTDAPRISIDMATLAAAGGLSWLAGNPNMPQVHLNVFKSFRSMTAADRVCVCACLSLLRG